MLCRSIIITSLFFSWHSLVLPILVAGTLVKTPQGLFPVEQLVVGSMVITQGDAGLKEVKILRITKHTINTIFTVTTQMGSFTVGKDQFLYDLDTNRWIRSQDIINDTIFMNCEGKLCHCLGVIVKYDLVDVYEITIEFPHVVFISREEIVSYC